MIVCEKKCFLVSTYNQFTSKIVLFHLKICQKESIRDSSELELTRTQTVQSSALKQVPGLREFAPAARGNYTQYSL